MGSTRERLKSWRKKSGLSQEGLAELVGCSQQAISNIENGERAPWLALAFDLERVSDGQVPARMWPPPKLRRGRAA